MDNNNNHTQSQIVDAFRRKLHERIGAWVAGHWTQMLSALGGIFVGATAIYGLFSSQVTEAKQAAIEAKQAAASLSASVAHLEGTVNQLVTQPQLQTVLERVTRLEEDYHVAYQQAATPPLSGKKRSRGKP